MQLHSHHFRRPMGLTRGEWRALELGLAMVQQELPPERQAIAEAGEPHPTPATRGAALTSAEGATRKAGALADGRVLLTASPELLRVRYAPRIARWILEREGGEPEPDGAVIRKYPLADDAWAVRHVLQYGPDAEVLAPARVREAVRARLEAIAGVRTAG